MSQQLGRYYLEKCRICGTSFAVDRSGVHFLLCGNCRGPVTAERGTFAAPARTTRVRGASAAPSKVVYRNGLRVESRGRCPVASHVRKPYMTEI